MKQLLEKLLTYSVKGRQRLPPRNLGTTGSPCLYDMPLHSRMPGAGHSARQGTNT